MRNCTKIYIDGAWVAAASGEVIDVTNPATEQLAGQIASGNAADVDRAVNAARSAFRTFSKTTRQERTDLLNSVLSAYAGRHQDLADALVEELGAPAKFAMEMQVGVGFLHLQTAIKALSTYAFEYAPRGLARWFDASPLAWSEW